ncbi:MAG: hypothetical protein ACPIA7_01145 [Akkermansiaceae bacterium]
MKQALKIIALLFFTTSLHAQQALPADESRVITAEVKAMMLGFNEGNAELIIKKTHPAIWKLAGGQEKFESSIAQAVKQMMDTGIKIDSLKVEQPSTFYKAGKESICFVPMSSIMHMKDQKIASTSFMIAVKGEQGEWKYLDGTFVRTNPDQLWTFFPELPKEVELPETKLELLQ